MADGNTDTVESGATLYRYPVLVYPTIPKKQRGYENGGVSLIFHKNINTAIVKGYSFFISNPIFRLSLELLSEVPKMRLKIAMKLRTFFGDYRLK